MSTFSFHHFDLVVPFPFPLLKSGVSILTHLVGANVSIVV